MDRLDGARWRRRRSAGCGGAGVEEHGRLPTCRLAEATAPPRQDDEAVGDHLIGDREAHEDQAIVEHAHDQRADQCADDDPCRRSGGCRRRWWRRSRSSGRFRRAYTSPPVAVPHKGAPRARRAAAHISTPVGSSGARFPRPRAARGLSPVASTCARTGSCERPDARSLTAPPSRSPAMARRHAPQPKQPVKLASVTGIGAGR